jgi:hypothetical protein
MMKWLKWPRILWAIAILIFAYGCLQYLVLGSPSFVGCIKQEAQNQADHTPRENNPIASVAVGYRDCLGQFLNENTGAITGLGTAFVALFTLTLYLITNKAVNLARREFEVNQRPVVYIQRFESEITTEADADLKSLPEDAKSKQPELAPTRFAVQPIWRNSGENPTRNMRIRVHWTRPGQAIRFGKYPDSAEREFFVGPKASVGSEFIQLHGLEAIIKGGFGESDARGAPQMFIWGDAKYGDDFGGKHWVRWCYRIRPERHRRGLRLRAHFIQWTDYNDSGEGEMPEESWEETPEPSEE